MPELTSTKTFIDSNPGAKTSGPSHAPSHWDHLPVPGGGTIGTTDTQVLRRMFHKMGIEGAHRDGRDPRKIDYRMKIDEHLGPGAVWNFVKISPEEAWCFDSRVFGEERRE